MVLKLNSLHEYKPIFGTCELNDLKMTNEIKKNYKIKTITINKISRNKKSMLVNL